MFKSCSEFLFLGAFACFSAFIVLSNKGGHQVTQNYFQAVNQVKIVEKVVVPYKDTFFNNLEMTDHCVPPFNFECENPDYVAKVKPVWEYLIELILIGFTWLVNFFTPVFNTFNRFRFYEFFVNSYVLC